MDAKPEIVTVCPFKKKVAGSCLRLFWMTRYIP